MKKNKTKNILFVAGVGATEGQIKLALKHNAVIRNSLLVPEDGALEKNDGVFGDVPKRYKGEDGSNIVQEAQKEYEALKEPKKEKGGSGTPGTPDREALKAELDELGVDYAKNTGTEKLAKLLEEVKASKGGGDEGDMLG